MGQYPITAGVFGKALAIPGTGNTNIIPESAWLFENQQQTPITGTNYTGSQIYIGAAGDVIAILAGVTGAQDTVTVLNLSPTFPANPSYPGFSGGTGYTTGAALATSVTSLVHKSPANQPSGLTVDITANVMATVDTAGLTYTNGAFTVTGGSGLTGTIGVNAGTGAIETVIITDLGTASVSDTFEPQGRGGDGNGLIIVQSLGEVTAVTINAAGTNYSVGDICTVVQAGSDGNCKFAIGAVQSLLPTQVADAVTFKAISAGTILPVAIDYVLACPLDSVALK